MSRINMLRKSINHSKMSNKDYKQLVASKIKDELRRRNWTNRQFAQAMNRGESQTSKWLSGKHNFTVITIWEIETVLSIKIVNLDL